MEQLGIYTRILPTVFKQPHVTGAQADPPAEAGERVVGQVPQSAGALGCGLGHVPFLHRGQCLLLTCGQSSGLPRLEGSPVLTLKAELLPASERYPRITDSLKELYPYWLIDNEQFHKPNVFGIPGT